MATWVVLVCAAVVCAHALLWLRGRRARALLAGLPTYPINLPFLGNLLYVLKDSPNMLPIIKDMGQRSEERGLPCLFWIATTPLISCSDPEDVKTVSNAFVDKPYYYRFSQDWLGTGLLVAPGPIWRHNIKNLGGSFTGSVVDGYQGVFNRQAARLVQQLRGEAGGQPFDVMSYLAYTSLESIYQTALCIPDVDGSVVTPEHYVAFNRAMELFIQRGTNPLVHLDFMYRLTPAYKELLGCVDILRRASFKAINRRREERRQLKSGVMQENKSENGRVGFKSYLDILLDLSELDPTMTQDQIQSEVDAIILAGQDTVAITSHMALLMLGCHPDAQEKLYAEMKEIFGDSKRPVQKEDLLRMRYCEAVINESVRLFPAGPFIFRVADRDLPLRSCVIPKGSICGINIWSAGRSKKAWGDDADQFRPDRWLEADQSTGYPTSFFGFSVGRRSCIGRRYAMAILKTILTYCIRELVIESKAEKLQLKSDVLLKAIGGHLIQVHLRENK